MARGWESKAVESQIDSAETGRVGRKRPTPKSVDEIERDAKLHGLMMSRTRVLHDLQGACNPRYRGQLEQALAFLDQQIEQVHGK